jgi:hypothetical protein
LGIIIVTGALANKFFSVGIQAGISLMHLLINPLCRELSGFLLELFALS